MGRSRKRDLRAIALLNELHEIAMKHQVTMSSMTSTSQEIQDAKIAYETYLEVLQKIRDAFGWDISPTSQLAALRGRRTSQLTVVEPHQDRLHFIRMLGTGYEYVHSVSFLAGKQPHVGHYVWKDNDWTPGGIARLYRSGRQTTGKTIPKHLSERYWSFLHEHPVVQEHLSRSGRLLQTLQSVNRLRIEDASVLDRVRVGQQHARALRIRLRGLDYTFTLFYDLQFQRCIGCEVTGEGYVVQGGPVVRRVQDMLSVLVDQSAGDRH